MDNEQVRIITADENQWKPISGEETEALIDHLAIPDSSKDHLREETAVILSRCVNPRLTEGRETCLVVGYVQSGKTMSFTAVSAMARDNGYRLIIVVTGVSTPLFSQSTTRLHRDLRLNERIDRKWYDLANPTPDDAPRVADALEDWNDPDLADSVKQTVIITVMKNHNHLSNLCTLLSRLELRGVAALVIDDEADQAGLNTQVRQGGVSTTYSRLLDIRSVLPHHSFLQYTATPQAPLLITLIDMLSPDYVALLTPGADYMGGSDFFNGDRSLIHEIPPGDIPTQSNPLDGPPDTLLAAMATYFVGVAAMLASGNKGGVRSMMVHPSRLTLQHGEYHSWVANVKLEWERVFNLKVADADREELTEFFREAYENLQNTASDLPSFEQILSNIRWAIRRTEIHLVNSISGSTPVVNWRTSPSHILVGGQAMDRGFTVEGLTVTYMPRGTGVGNADTVQQRARFLGYKRGYRGYCRVYLERQTIDAYTQYAQHEEDIRNRLQSVSDSGQGLNDWRRAFFLSSSLRPTRRNVLALDYMRGAFSNKWFNSRVPHESAEAITSNSGVVKEFSDSLDWVPDDGHNDRTQFQRHLVNREVSLQHAYNHLLAQLRWTNPVDSQPFLGILLQIDAHLQERGDENCTIYWMSSGAKRIRSVDDDNQVLNLFQGAHPDNTGSIYPGDRKLRGRGELVVQLHRVQIDDANRAVICDNTIALALWVPQAFARTWVIQDQGGRSG